MEILKSQKNVFWEALVITLFIFGLGVLIGIFIENNRADSISQMYLTSEINLLDVQIQTEILNLIDGDCTEIIRKNAEFGDKIYEDGKVLEKYEGASRMTDVLREQHRRYDLLRTLFWVNSIKIKKRCNNPFSTLVYLYNYEPEDIEQKSKQIVFSRFLEEIKQEMGDRVMLIPIAKNMELSSLDILISKYNLSDVSVIADESFVVTEVNELEKIREHLSKGIISLN